VRRRAVRLPSGRHRRPGAVRANRPGEVLRCVLLARGPEWVIVDVATGALVRSRASGWPVVATDSSLVAGASLDGDRGKHHIGPELDVVEIELADDDEPSDPARPEAVMVRHAPERVGTPRRRAVRRILHELLPPTQNVLCSDHWVLRSRMWTSTAHALRSRSSLPTGHPPSPATWQARGASSASEAASTVCPWSTNASSTPRTDPATALSRAMPS